jgi:hypothetical protein
LQTSSFEQTQNKSPKIGTIFGDLISLDEVREKVYNTVIVFISASTPTVTVTLVITCELKGVLGIIVIEYVPAASP